MLNRSPLFVVVVGVGSLLAMATADDRPKLPQPPRFPFGDERAKQYQDDYAKATGTRNELTNSIEMKLALIPPGNFEMGANGSKYRVSLSKPFYAGVTEVTLGHYRKFKPGHTVEGADKEFQHDDRPAAMVSWEDAKAFCVWLSSQDAEKKAGRVYTLPTEAQ